MDLFNKPLYRQNHRGYSGNFEEGYGNVGGEKR